VSEAPISSIQQVHRWRGTPEQRAALNGIRKLGQFAYFDEVIGHPAWRDGAVLDFGGGDGNLLRNDDCAIEPANYWCIDVVKEAIDEGRAAFPGAHWAHYDRYNCSFNPGGVRDLPIPNLGVAFDFILAYSVFTHTTLEEMRELVGQLRAQLAPGGVLAFTFEDPHFEPWPETRAGSNLRLRLETLRGRPGLDPERVAAQANGAEWCALVGGTSLFVNDNGQWDETADGCLTYDVYYTVALMQREFPDAQIVAPANGEMQHCCVVRRRG
jgi:SAM-dependent methyltransferase